MIAIDSETALFGPGLVAPPLVCVSSADERTPPRLFGAGRGLDFVGHSLLSGEPIVGQNIRYDLCVFIAAGLDQWFVFDALDRGQIVDTMIGDQLINIARGEFDGKKYDLASLVRRRFGAEMEKGDVRTSFGKLRGVPVEAYPEEASRYAKMDAVATLKVRQSIEADRMMPWGEGTADILADEPAQVRAAFALQLTTAWGLRTDPAAVTKLKAELLVKKAEHDKKLVKLGVLRSDDTKDTKTLQRLVRSAYEEKGEEVPLTPKGAVETSKRALLDSGDDLLVEIAGDVSGKYLTTYVPWLEMGTKHPVCASYQALVSTGRTSSFEPNIQNQPKRGGIRECFVPRPGFVFVDADYSTLELRAWAQAQLDMFGESVMAEALWREHRDAGPDLHSLLAAEIFNEDPQALFEAYKAGDTVADDKRKLAKAPNFGFPGGMGAKKFVDFARAAYKVVLTEQRAYELKAAWARQWKAGRFFDFMGQMQKADGKIDIRLTRSGRIHGGKYFPEACNLTFQGPSADGAKAALYEVQRRSRIQRDSALYGTRAVAFVHDEILIEAPRDRAKAAEKELCEVMVNEMKKHLPDVPVVVEAGISERWGA